MRIGVFIGDYVPEVGGGFTFVAQVVEAFLKAGGEAVEHQFVIFCGLAAIPALKIGAVSGANIEFCALPKRAFLERAWGAATRYSPLLAYLYRKPSALERLAWQQQVEMIWFVGGGVYEIPDMPYIATVWDIQHRTHPWFPEVSAHGEWNAREVTYASFLRRATYVITGTQIGAEQLGFYYQIPRELIRILPHPTPELQEISDPRSDSAIAAKFSGRQFICYPAQFWPHKNHVNLLKALNILEARYGLSLELALTGSDKGNRAHVVQIGETLGLNDRVHFLGFVKTGELIFLYRNALALVYPSFSGPENLPPLEAFSQGCPVLIAEYPGAREQLGDAAVYFDPRQPEDIAEKLALLCGDANLRESLIQKGRVRAENWTAVHYVTGVMDIFKSFQTVRSCWGKI